MAGRRSSRRALASPPQSERIRIESTVGTLELLHDRSRPGGRTLLIDGLTHGYVDLSDPAHLELDYIARIGAALEILLPRGEAATVLHLGGGAFTLPRFLASTRPQITQTVVERSQAVVNLAEKHLRLRRSERLHVMTADGVDIVERADDASYDLVLGDAFVGTDTPPAMATPTFALDVHRILRPGGAYLLNVVDQPPWPFAAMQAQILRARFEHVVAFGGREVVRGKKSGNVLFLASDTPVPEDALGRRLAGGAHPAELVTAERMAGWG